MMLKFYFPVFTVFVLMFFGCASPGNIKYVGVQTYPSSKSHDRIFSGNEVVDPNQKYGSYKGNYYYRQYASQKDVSGYPDSSGTVSLFRSDNDILRRNIVVTAKKYIGVKYKYGGADPDGFDCSGFSLYVFRQNGINLPRSAQQQYDRGHRIRGNTAKPGDLVFFSDSGRKITHVGIYLGDNMFIHAPSTGKSVEIREIDANYYAKRIAGFASFIN